LALSFNGFVVDLALDGIQALEKLSKASYNSIITDIKMPNMNGIEFICKVKSEKLSNADIFVITGCLLSEYSDHDREVMRRYAEGYIKKPFNTKKLLRVLKP
jgi:YesN/AraC family two-component response regulator